MLNVAQKAPGAREFALPHEDVVLYAIVHVANLNQVHPWSIGQGIVRRPALMAWIGGVSSSMHYSAMRQFITKLVTKYDVEFDTDGFSVRGKSKYIRCRGIAPPPILANPSAL